MSEIKLSGTVVGRAKAMPELDSRGVPKPASHDKDVTLTLNFPMPGTRLAEFDVHYDRLPRGFMEIGQRVIMVIVEAEDE